MKSAAYIHNENQLAEINATLNPPKGEKTGKIGLFCPGKNGDILTVMSVLPHIEKLWPCKDIIWYCNLPMAENLKYSNVSEVRPYPWEGIEVDPYTQLMDPETNRLRQDRKLEFEITADLEDGYFPAAWMMSVEKRHSIPYTDVSKKIFGVPDDWTWKPMLNFRQAEFSEISSFVEKLPHKKTILIENDFQSGQSGWNDHLTERTIKICEEQWGLCNFIFVSGNDNSKFMDDGIVSASQFTVRQCGMFAFVADLFIGVSSGISVAISSLNFNAIPIIQYCNSIQCSTLGLSEGIDFHLIAPNDMENEFPKHIKDDVLQTRYEHKLIEILNKYK